MDTLIQDLIQDLPQINMEEKKIVENTDPGHLVRLVVIKKKSVRS